LAERLSIPHKIWRALPVRHRRAVLAAAAGLLAPRKDAVPPRVSDGIVVAGEFSQTTGVAEAARVFAGACTQLGVAQGTLDLGVGGRPAGAIAKNAALLLTVNAPSIPLMFARADKGIFRGHRIIGHWAWELPVVPKSWEVGRRYVHEAWTCSAFAAGALERVMPGRVRVVPYPLAMLAPPDAAADFCDAARMVQRAAGAGLGPAPGPDARAAAFLGLERAADRAGFGMPAGAVVTAMVFSLGSSFVRKNPLAGIRAFVRAFGDRDDQLLVVKFSGAAAFAREAAALAAAVAGRRNVKLFSGNWPAERLAAFLACADIVLSLHRAEGFGLVPAQAMLRGTPVVATGWSGNMTYMDADSAALVGFELVPVVDAGQIYESMPGAVWAEPDVGHAAEQLRRLGDDAGQRAALGRQGQVFAGAALNGDALRAALAANGIDGA